MQLPNACSWDLCGMVELFWGPSVLLPEQSSCPLSSCTKNASYSLASESHKSHWQYQLPFYGGAAFLKHNCTGMQTPSCWNHCYLSVNEAKFIVLVWFGLVFSVFSHWVCKYIFRNPTVFFFSVFLLVSSTSCWTQRYLKSIKLSPSPWG